MLSACLTEFLLLIVDVEFVSALGDDRFDKRLDGGVSLAIVEGAVRFRSLFNDVMTFREVVALVVPLSAVAIDRGGEIGFFWKRLTTKGNSSF